MYKPFNIVVIVAALLLGGWAASAQGGNMHAPTIDKQQPGRTETATFALG